MIKPFHERLLLDALTRIRNTEQAGGEGKAKEKDKDRDKEREKGKERKDSKPKDSRYSWFRM